MMQLKKLNKLSLGFTLSAAIIFFALPLSGFAKTFDRVVAKVNDSIITLSEVEDRARLITIEQSQENTKPRPDKELKKEELDLILEEKLLIQEGKRLNINIGDSNVEDAVNEIKKTNNVPDDIFIKMLEKEGITLKQYKKKIKDQIVISKVRNNHLRNFAKISEKTSKEYYKKHRKDFLTPAKIHVRHILFIFGENITSFDKEIKQTKAKEAVTELRSGKLFISVAKKYSEDISASSGGDLGILERGKMLKEFEDAAFKLKQGQISPIVETAYGLHIIKVDKVYPQRYKSFKEVLPEIENKIFSKQVEKKYKRWVEKLKDSAFVEVYLFGLSKRIKSKQTSKVAQTARLPERSTLKRKNNSEKKRAKRSKKRMRSISNQSSTEMESLKKRLEYIKILKKRNIISKAEYEKRKKNLLEQL